MLGKTLFETIAAMAVMSLMAAGIYKLTNSIIDRYKLSRINNQVYALQKVINERFMAEGNYDMKARHGSKSILQLLKEENLLDTDMRTCKGGSKGYYCKHAFNGRIYAGGLKIDGQDGEKEAGRYYILFEPGTEDEEIWTQVCMSFGDMNWLSEGGSSLVKQCYGDCSIKNGDKDKEDEDFGCACSYEIPADEETLENCSGSAKILWIFE